MHTNVTSKASYQITSSVNGAHVIVAGRGCQGVSARMSGNHRDIGDRWTAPRRRRCRMAPACRRADGSSSPGPSTRRARSARRELPRRRHQSLTPLYTKIQAGIFLIICCCISCPNVVHHQVESDLRKPPACRDSCRRGDHADQVVEPRAPVEDPWEQTPAGRRRPSEEVQAGIALMQQQFADRHVVTSMSVRGTPCTYRLSGLPRPHPLAKSLPCWPRIRSADRFAPRHRRIGL